MGDSIIGRAFMTVLRGWWIVLALTVIAAGVAWAVSGGTQSMYQADIAMNIDNATVSKYPALPIPENLLAEVQASEFTDEVLTQAGVDGGDLSFYTSGNPQTLFHVRYVGESKEDALDVVELAARSVGEKYLEMSKLEIQPRMDTLNEMRLTNEMLKEAVSNEDLSHWEELDIELKIHSLTRQIIEVSALLEQQTTAYSVKGVASVKELEATSSRARAAIAAGLVGLILGVGIALLRDRSWRVGAG